MKIYSLVIAMLVLGLSNRPARADFREFSPEDGKEVAQLAKTAFESCRIASVRFTAQKITNRTGGHLNKAELAAELNKVAVAPKGEEPAVAAEVSISEKASSTRSGYLTVFTVELRATQGTTACVRKIEIRKESRML